jgi:Zn-dependent protease
MMTTKYGSGRPLSLLPWSAHSPASVRTKNMSLTTTVRMYSHHMARPASLAFNHNLPMKSGNNTLGRPPHHPLSLVTPLGPLLPGQLGAVSHFSSMGGRGGGGGGNRWAQGVGMLGAAGVLLGKGKYLLGALKLTKFASLGSMILSIGTYSIFFGLPYAAGMVGLILVHEAGHAAVMVHRGIPFSPMVFMPFMGAVIAMNRMPRDAWEDALVALGGPVLGSAGAGVVAVVGHATDSQLLYALADFGFMVNLFNLLPIGSMDGGRIAGALSPYAGVVGLGLGGTLAYTGVVHNPIFYIVLIAGGYDTFMRFYDPHHVPPNYYKISGPQRMALTGGYFGLVAALIMAMDANSRYRKPPEVLIQEREMEKSWDTRY